MVKILIPTTASLSEQPGLSPIIKTHPIYLHQASPGAYSILHSKALHSALESTNKVAPGSIAPPRVQKSTCTEVSDVTAPPRAQRITSKRLSSPTLSLGATKSTSEKRPGPAMLPSALKRGAWSPGHLVT
ncbi:hypothetical protein MHYP_G00359900 [Metynnis hypsauchen]